MGKGSRFTHRSQICHTDHLNGTNKLVSDYKRIWAMYTYSIFTILNHPKFSFVNFITLFCGDIVVQIAENSSDRITKHFFFQSCNLIEPG